MLRKTVFWGFAAFVVLTSWASALYGQWDMPHTHQPSARPVVMESDLPTPRDVKPDPYADAFGMTERVSGGANYSTGSLWGESCRFNNPFGDLPAPDFEIGDVIVVKVNENFRSREEIRLQNETESEVTFNVASFWNKALDPKIFGTEGGATDYPNTGITGTDDYDAESRGRRQSQLTIDIPCTVTKFTTEGGLLIEGRQARVIGRDKKVRVFSGVVRPEDVDPVSRTVASTRVADSQLKWEGKGPGENTANPGLIHRILDYIPLF
ncbi:MAG: flagellar basal body L-ring protein FlgH [Candidatus Omnitrophica bacterium]|nr:Flagellar L-ring protein [bacterium]NUN96939.1 flagellar basal body L-ring protein FlgH [Candidatus Omnitrophota bacterium]